MRCLDCGSAAVTERPERTAQGYRRFRCRECGKQFNERSAGVLNRTQYPSDVIALVVLWRLRYRLTLRDLAEMFLIRGIVFSYEAVREWEAKLTPILSDELRQRRHRHRPASSWNVDETYIKVRCRWSYLYRATAQRISDAIGRQATTLDAYGGYVFGPTYGARIASESGSTPLSAIIPSSYLTNNGMQNWTVADFRSTMGNRLGSTASQVVLTGT